ncbi:MAG: cell envelope integrity protein TolA [Hyphomicrobiaceae bacterium]
MTIGMALSLLLHAALLGYAMLSIGQTTPREPKEPVEAIIADVISESDLNRMRKGVREAKLDAAQPKDVKDPDSAAKEPPKPRPVTAQPPPPAEPPTPPEPPVPAEAAKAEPPPPPPVAKTEPPPKAEPPKPDPDQVALEQKLDELALKKAEEDKERKEAEAKAKSEAEAKAKADEEKRKAHEQKLADEKRKAEEHKKAEEKKKADEKRKRQIAEAKRKALEKKRAEEKHKRELAKKKQFDANRLSALLDKTPDPKQAAAANDAPDKPTDAKGPVRGDTNGRDHTISANEASFLAGLMRQAVSRCWNINAGLDGIQQMAVKVEIHLTREGRLAAAPRVVNNMASPVFRDAADSAVRALVQCEPYILPPDKFEGGWEHMILTFDPARMF